MRVAQCSINITEKKAAKKKKESCHWISCPAGAPGTTKGLKKLGDPDLCLGRGVKLSPLKASQDKSRGHREGTQPRKVRSESTGWSRWRALKLGINRLKQSCLLPLVVILSSYIPWCYRLAFWKDPQIGCRAQSQEHYVANKLKKGTSSMEFLDQRREISLLSPIFSPRNRIPSTQNSSTMSYT